jgi:NAD(P)-dependent dehydrogenase (short-subunit alcohol dehydrogenase family)
MQHPAALVTGASRGIGRGIAIELGRAGFAVVVNYATRADAAAEVVAEIVASGGNAMPLKGNVAIASDRSAMVEQTLAAFGRLDVLVNNAGITSQGRKDILEATEESFNAVFDTNLKGPFFLTQFAASEMIRLIQQASCRAEKSSTSRPSRRSPCPRIVPTTAWRRPH